MRTYTELSRIDSFEERFEYLKLEGFVGESTFGFDRYLNQIFYRTPRWKSVRNQVIIRDNGCDLGIDGYDILKGRIIIHHMNPLSLRDIEEDNPDIYNPEYLICTTHNTHNAIHYGDKDLLMLNEVPVRRPYDTCPWR